MNLNSYKLETTSLIQKINYRDLIIFIMPIMIFSLYLFIYNPGVLTIDSYNQLHQIATGHFTNWHPFFYTFIEMICLKIYGSPASVGVFQIIVFALMWTVICKYHRDDTTEDSTQFFLQFILTVIICLIPINAIYSITLWKDVLFSYCLMFLCFLIKVMIDKEGHIDYKILILMALMMAFIAELRVNGIYIVIPTLIILALYLFRKDNAQKMYIALPAVTIILILLIGCLNVAYDVEDSQRDAVFAKTAHMLSEYDLTLDLDQTDKTKLYKMINESQIKAGYSPTYSDPIYWAANEQVFDADRGGYITMAIKYSLFNPLRFVKYALKSSAIVWDITRDDTWKGQPYYISSDGAHIENARDTYYKNTNSTPADGFDNASALNLGSSKYYSLNSYVNSARENGVLDTLFNSPALYMYLAIILLVAIHFITGSKRMYLVYLPIALNIVIIFASIPVQDNRFLYANLLAFYLLMIIFINILCNLDGRPQPVLPTKSLIPKRQKEEKRLKSPYAPSSEDQYIGEETKSEYVPPSIESEIEDLSLDEINSLLEELSTTEEEQKPLETAEIPEDSGSDLVDEILKEIEMGKK